MVMIPVSHSKERRCAFRIQIKGLVQGVGFRPMVWRLAQRYHIQGRVSNNGEGIQLIVAGGEDQIRQFMTDLTQHSPPLAHVTEILPTPIAPHDVPEDTFVIARSDENGVQTGIVPDTAPCWECLQEILDPFARRYYYPFTNCTQCGPRFTIQEGIPYDRAKTTMKEFILCGACLQEYQNPKDRRFHAQPMACHTCGPRVWMTRADGTPVLAEPFTTTEVIDTACLLLQKGFILAIKGVGGFQLACNATQESTVKRLRTLKHRDGKPFALMASDLEVIRDYCLVGTEEAALLQDPAAPIVLLKRRKDHGLAPSVAPGLSTYGFMLPNSPLHHLMLKHLRQPIVLTSGNLSGEPQWIDNEEAQEHLKDVADCFFVHDRRIAHRLDDSVAKIIGQAPRILRRSRGHAPSPLWLPHGFDKAPPLLAMGSELKNTFCLFKKGQAILSHHIGDLEDALTYTDYQRAISHYQRVFDHSPQIIAIDQHPEYLSSKLGKEFAKKDNLEIITIQHHHAHLAACLAENGISFNTAPILGVILDGLGYGADHTIWGGEFLLGDYTTFRRLGTFKPMSMLGGTQAIKEPWRNTYAHIITAMGWPQFSRNYSNLTLFGFLDKKPRTLLDGMLMNRINSPLASSCGRLFDAVAAAMGICTEHVLYEGQAAMEMEALVDEDTLKREDDTLAYSFTISTLKDSGLPSVDPLAMWQALLDDLMVNTPIPVMAARFHKGLANAICTMVKRCSHAHNLEQPRFHTVALSGGVFQNQVLFELVKHRMEEDGFTVLSHKQTPMNDGGLALGQAAIGAARFLQSAQKVEAACV